MLKLSPPLLLKTASVIICFYLIILAASCSDQKLQALSQEEQVFWEVLEIDLLETLARDGTKKTLWLHDSITFTCYQTSNEAYDFSQIQKTYPLSFDQSSSEELSDSIYIETYIQYNFTNSGLDTLWDFTTKRNYLIKKFFGCQKTMASSQIDFKSKKIKSRNQSFNTYHIGNPVVLNNGEYVLFDKSIVCGDLCSESGTYIYRRVKGKWVSLPTLIMMS